MRACTSVAALLLLAHALGCGADASSGPVVQAGLGRGQGPASAALHVDGRFFKDAYGAPVRLRSINWEGFADRHLMLHGLDRARFEDVVALIKRLGFNSVRVPFSNQLLRFGSWEHARQHLGATSRHTFDAAMSRNPVLARTSTPQQAFRTLVAGLTAAGLYVILDNHQTTLNPCCREDDDALWFGERQGEIQWLADWDTMAGWFHDNPNVIGYELRNEVRGKRAHWGDRSRKWEFDLRRASAQAAGFIWRHGPAKIIFIGGLDYNTRFDAVAANPLGLADFGPGLRRRITHETATGQPQIAYSAHVYGWFGDKRGTHLHLLEWPALVDHLCGAFGFMLAPGRAYTAPVWVSEFGTRAQLDSDSSYRRFLHHTVEFMNVTNVDFAYFTLANYYPKEPRSPLACADERALDRLLGAQPARAERHCNTYGLVRSDFVTPTADWRIGALGGLMRPPANAPASGVGVCVR